MMPKLKPGTKMKTYKTTRGIPTSKKTTTEEGFREYMQKYMARLRAEKKRLKTLGEKS